MYIMYAYVQYTVQEEDNKLRRDENSIYNFVNIFFEQTN